MQKYQDVVLDSQGDAISGVTVTVKNYPADTLATIYSDNGVTLIASSQITSDANGKYAFYAANGRYNLNFLKTGFVSTTLTDVMVQDYSTVSSGGLGAGTVNAPTLTFGGDTTTGMYRPAANQIGLSASGVNVATFSSSGLQLTAGSVGAPSLNFGDTTTGMYRPAANQIGFTVSGTQRLVLDSNGLLGYGVGGLTPTSGWYIGAASVLEFGGSGNSMFSLGTGTLHIMTGAYFNSSGQFIYTGTGQSPLRYAHNSAIGHQFQSASPGTAGGAFTFLPGLTIDTSNNVYVGNTQLTTTATLGFFSFPSCPGAPTGAVTAPYISAATMVYDSTNNKIYIRSGGTWRSTAALT